MLNIMIQPVIEKQSKQIDKDICECIKAEIKTYGSIIKRYGDWAKFLKKEITIVELKNSQKYIPDKALFYRGKFIRKYRITIEMEID